MFLPIFCCGTCKFPKQNVKMIILLQQQYSKHCDAQFCLYLGWPVSARFGRQVRHLRGYAFASIHHLDITDGEGTTESVCIS